MELDFTKLNGLVPAVVQDAQTDKVLMVAFMNKAALEKTIVSGQVTFTVGPSLDFGPKGKHRVII